MSTGSVQLALTIFADATHDGVLDMKAAIADDDLWARNEERIADDVKVKFFNPPGADLEIMEQDYVGIEGLRRGWRNWLGPWGSYMITIDEVIDAGDDRVLLLVTSVARMHGSRTEVPESAATMFRVENGLIAEINFYLNQDQAREDAGLA